MPTIGGRNVTVMQGDLGLLGETLESITRPHVDGYAFRKAGQRAEPVNVVTHEDVADLAAATAARLAYKNMQGTLVTVVDGAGETWNNVVVRLVRVKRYPIATPVGGLVALNAATYMVECQWTLQPTETR